MSGIPLEEILKMNRLDIAHDITRDFLHVEVVKEPSNNYNYNTHIYHDTKVNTEIFLISREMFYNIEHFNIMMEDLERREEEVRKKEKEFKKLKNDLKHINELSKNVNQLFKGL
jgi:hypothetical protein